MTTQIDAEGAARFGQGEAAIIRQPVQASMTDGTMLRGYRYQRETPPPARVRGATPHSNTPLLCLASELGNSREHHEFILALMRLPGAPKRVWTVDLRGRGRSELGTGSNSSTYTDAEDLISFCDAMGLHDVDTLVSGRTTLAVLLTGPKRPGLVRRLILNDGGPELDGVGIARQTALRQRMHQPTSWGEAFETMRQNRGEQFPILDDKGWQQMARHTWRDEDGKPVPDYDKGLVRLTNAVNYDEKQPLLWTEFKLFSQHPTLLVRGEHSLLMTEEIASRLAARHDDFKEIIATGQGHNPLLNLGDLPNQICRFLATSEDLGIPL